MLIRILIVDDFPLIFSSILKSRFFKSGGEIAHEVTLPNFFDKNCKELAAIRSEAIPK